MIKPAALLMGVVMASLATGTYYGLDLLPPGLIPPPLGRVPPPEIAATRPAEPIAMAEATAPTAYAPP